MVRPSGAEKDVRPRDQGDFTISCGTKICQLVQLVVLATKSDGAPGLSKDPSRCRTPGLAGCVGEMAWDGVDAACKRSKSPFGRLVAASDRYAIRHPRVS